MTSSEKYLIAVAIAGVLLFFINPAATFLFAGVLAFGYMLVSYPQFRTIQKKGIVCKGKIISFRHTGRGHAKPVIEFTAQNGQTVTGTPFVYMSVTMHTVKNYNNATGGDVDVIYNPYNPGMFILKNGGAHLFTFIMGALICFAFIVLGICGLLGYIDMF